MSTFDVEAFRIEEVREHPNAERLEVIPFRGYQAVVQKGTYQVGNIAVYVPEQAVVPKEILKAAGFWDYEKNHGILSGSHYNRVKAKKLRGLLSQGIILAPWKVGIIRPKIGHSYTELLGIKKFEPKIPAELAGKVDKPIGNADINSYTDIENIKRRSDVFNEDDVVTISEKLHGTCSIFRCEPNGDFSVSSKGIAKRRLVIQESSVNTYWKIAKQFDLPEKLATLAKAYSKPVTLYGETVGVQDLMYGLAPGELQFFAFDLRIGFEYVAPDEFWAVMDLLGIPRVPVVYTGHFIQEVIIDLANGKSLVAPNQIREGIVIRSMNEEVDRFGERKIVKSISDSYLTRKGNTTEYE